MSSFRSIRVRLTAWYFASIILLLAILAHGSWRAGKASIYHAVDDGLIHRMDGVIEVLNQHSELDEALLAKQLAESSNLMIGGSLFRVFDGNNRLVYQSAGLARHQVMTGPPTVSGSIVFRHADRG